MRGICLSGMFLSKAMADYATTALTPQATTAYFADMQHAEIIRQLGGPTRLAKDLGLPVVATVGHWPSRGIPSRYWHRVVSLATERGISITFRDLERQDDGATPAPAREKAA